MRTSTNHRSLSDPLLRALSDLIGMDMDQEPARVSRDLADGVAALSERFTRNRDDRMPSYQTDDRMRLAYLAYYLPVNLAKIQALLDELPPDAAPRPDHACGSPDKSFRVLDVGSGPGTATLAVLDWLMQRAAPWSGSIDAIAVDHSAHALQTCEVLWNRYGHGRAASTARLAPIRTDLKRWRRVDDLPTAIRSASPYDLIIVANTLNELFGAASDPVARRVRLVRLLLDLLDETGSLVILEPALRTTARGLHQLRDLLVSEHACTVHSPCLHEQGCPALVDPDDWCHEERAWTAPKLVAAIDRQVGFIKDALKFSYLILRKDGRTIVSRAPGVYRVVSELREMKGEQRAWLCNETGRPEVGRLDRERSVANAAMDDWRRGAIVRIDQIIRPQRNGREAAVGRIPASATVEMIRPV